MQALLLLLAAVVAGASSAAAQTFYTPEWNTTVANNSQLGFAAYTAPPMVAAGGSFACVVHEVYNATLPYPETTNLRVVCFTAATGGMLWQDTIETGATSWITEPVIVIGGNDTVVVVSAACAGACGTFAYDASTGRRLWGQKFAGAIAATPGQKHLVVVGIDAVVRTVDILHGKPAWATAVQRVIPQPPTWVEAVGWLVVARAVGTRAAPAQTLVIVNEHGIVAHLNASTLEPPCAPMGQPGAGNGVIAFSCLEVNATLRGARTVAVALRVSKVHEAVHLSVNWTTSFDQWEEPYVGAAFGGAAVAYAGSVALVLSQTEGLGAFDTQTGVSMGNFAPAMMGNSDNLHPLVYCAHQGFVFFDSNGINVNAVNVTNPAALETGDFGDLFYKYVRPPACGAGRSVFQVGPTGLVDDLLLLVKYTQQVY